MTGAVAPSATLRVYAKPGARKSRFVSLSGEPPVLEVAVGARPVEGQANEELLSFLACELGVRRSGVSLEKGDTARHKTVRIEGLALHDVMARIAVRLDDAPPARGVER